MGSLNLCWPSLSSAGTSASINIFNHKHTHTNTDMRDYNTLALYEFHPGFLSVPQFTWVAVLYTEICIWTFNLKLEAAGAKPAEASTVQHYFVALKQLSSCSPQGSEENNWTLSDAQHGATTPNDHWRCFASVECVKQHVVCKRRSHNNSTVKACQRCWRQRVRKIRMNAGLTVARTICPQTRKSHSYVHQSDG